MLCVFGQVNPAPTADNWIGRFSFDTLLTPHSFRSAMKIASSSESIFICGALLFLSLPHLPTINNNIISPYSL